MIDRQSLFSGAERRGLVGTAASLLTAAWLMSTAACGGAPPKQAGDDNNFDQAPTGKASDSGEGSSSPAAPSEGGGALSEDQKKQMEIALRRGGDKASQCGSGVTGAKMGKGDVEVTFDGQKGRITDVSVGAPWAGTPAEDCIKRSFIGEFIMPFEGEPKAVPYTIELVDKKAGASDAKPPPKK